MLVNLKEILEIAEKRKIAIGAFNTPNLETIHAVIKAAEELNEPVIIDHAELHEDMGLCTLEEMGPIMLAAGQRAKVPVCVHLDHGVDMNYVKRGIEIGFTSVMYDGSVLSKEENIANTKEIVKLAHEKNASVEAEMGSMGERNGTNDDSSIFTDPLEAKEFVDATGVDALACAFGTVHGFYQKAPKLDFERLSKIYETISVPIVMHGGSGVSEDDYREVIKRGVRKINYYTYMAKAGGEAVSNKEYKQFHDVLLDGEKAMYENCKNAMSVFTGLKK